MNFKLDQHGKLQMIKPPKIKCPKCGHEEETTVCHWCGTNKLAKPLDKQK